MHFYHFVGFTGKRCEINVDDCQVNPCVHGTCTDGVNEYRCDCEDGFTGKNCDDEIDFCESSPCLHGGKCTSEPFHLIRTLDLSASYFKIMCIKTYLVLPLKSI